MALRRPIESTLAAAVGVVQQLAIEVAAAQRHLQGGGDQARLQVLLQRPANDAPGEEVDDVAR